MKTITPVKKQAKAKPNAACKTRALPKTLGELIQGRREEMGISLRELARRACVAHSFLSVLERDLAFASEDVLSRLAKALELPIEDIEKHDTSLPVEELRRLADRHPEFRLALRFAVQQIRSGHLTVEDLTTKLDGR
jgi:transcriptional regulator with XRE-family HTH domain